MDVDSAEDGISITAVVAVHAVVAVNAVVADDAGHAVVAVKAQPGFFLAQFIMHSEKFESRL